MVCRNKKKKKLKIKSKIRKLNQTNKKKVMIDENAYELPLNFTDIAIKGNGFSNQSMVFLYSNSNSSRPFCESILVVSNQEIVCQNVQALPNGPLFARVFSYGGNSGLLVQIGVVVDGL